ncbi:MAG: AAA family ATPase [Acidimicrobiales bacterium]
MRPLRLEVEGFGAFRSRTEVDFAGAELFALTGATGSGKTTLVDAMTFALYGCVPRYDHKGLVAPAISQGLNEARVRLDFSVGGTDYTAVRVVRRTANGATTKEARLLRGSDGEVLAGAAPEMAAAVEALLGLSYEHFTTCVVLPQGEFARFLHDKPEARQELLVRLLDLGVYRRMGQAARERAAATKERAAVVAARLVELADVTADAVTAAQVRVAVLTALLAAVDLELPALATLTAREEMARKEADEAMRWAELLGAIVVPDGIAALGQSLDAADATAVAACAAETAAAALLEAAEARVRARPERRALERALEAHEQAARHHEQSEKGERVLAERKADEQAATAALAGAESARAEAAAALEGAQSEHRAHALLADLVVGDPCPVCRQKVAGLPEAALPADLDAARRRRTAADGEVEHASAALRGAERHRHEIEAKLASITAQLAALAPVLACHPDPEAVAVGLAAVGEAEVAYEAAQDGDRSARRTATKARSQHDELRRREAAARSGFDETRDRLAPLAPPTRTGKGLAEDWAGLVTWAAGEARSRRTLAVEAGARATTLADERATRLAALRERCAVAGVTVSVPGGEARDAVVGVLARAEAEVSRLVAARAEAERATAELRRLEEARDVAGALALHLKADRFEKWVLDEALGLLVEGATGVLHMLSGGQYSLAFDDRSRGFAVVDHRNADEPRSARTLSGGETFLASLALALALADQVSLLAASGSVRLESIFLDEGFGSLDPDTLDAVAGAIEELGATGRMVGLISHVPELAERVPVRFVVTKVGTSSSVERIDQ